MMIIRLTISHEMVRVGLVRDQRLTASASQWVNRRVICGLTCTMLAHMWPALLITYLSCVISRAPRATYDQTLPIDNTQLSKTDLQVGPWNTINKRRGPFTFWSSVSLGVGLLLTLSSATLITSLMPSLQCRSTADCHGSRHGEVSPPSRYRYFTIAPQVYMDSLWAAENRYETMRTPLLWHNHVCCPWSAN